MAKGGFLVTSAVMKSLLVGIGQLQAVWNPP
jgi:hypothetical protein